MSEELLQRGLNLNPEKIGTWDFYNIGATTIKALKNYKIIPNRDYKGFETRKPDGLIVDKKGVMAVVENKNISKFKSLKDKQKAVQQGLEVAQVLGAKIVIATDSVNTTWINALNGEEILDEKGREIKTVFDPKNPDIAKLIERMVDCVRVDNSKLIEPRLKDPTKLAKSVWQDLWSVSGATPENCLYTFVELFIFKYLSDLGVLKGRLSYQFLMGQFQEETEEEVLTYYADTIRKRVKELFPAGNDGTTIINGTIFVSKDDVAVKGYGTVFKKILVKFGDEREGGGELTNIDKDFKSKLFETFLKESISKKNLGQFFTPLKVVKAMVEMAKSEIKPGISICDPACGVGKFLLEPLIAGDNIEQFFEVKNGKLNTKIDLWGVDKGFDKDEQRTIILAKANMLIYLSDLIRKHSDITPQFAEFFNKSFELKNKNILGTLQDTKKDEFDLILANPPYVTSGSSNLKDEIAKNGDLQAYYKINGMGVEGLFMEWIIRALKPGGKAFIVVPDGIFNRQNDKNLRQFIIDECFIDGIISLPIKTFFTTPKKTYILAITKKQNKSEIQKDPVFTYLVSEVGESRDIYRFDIEQNDLQKAVELFNAFKFSKDYFVKNNIDTRCKLQPFERLNPEDNWTVEKWWSTEEQIELGILEKDKTIAFEEVPALLDEIAENILSFKEEINELSQKKKIEIGLQEYKIEDLFDLNIKTNTSKFTKSFVEQNKGNIPVYSASKFEDTPDYGYVKDNLLGIKYFEDCLTWNIDGSIGKAFIRKGRFSLSEKVIPLVLREKFKEKFNLKFLKYEIENEFAKKGFDFSNKAGKGKIKDILIEIPISQSGEIDYEKQQEIIEKYEYTEKLKQKIEEYKKQIKEIQVEITNDYEVKIIKIGSIFDFKKGTNEFNKTKIELEKGKYPVYSGQTLNNGIIGFSNKWQYDGEFIRITTVGVNAGYVDLVKSKFSLAQNNGILIKNTNINFLDINYIFLSLKIKTDGLAKGDSQKSLLKSQILEIQIPIPVIPSGEFDLEAQQEIASKYQKIEQIKQSILVELDKISKTEIEL
jgi:type I restriction enzyme M protein